MRIAAQLDCSVDKMRLRRDEGLYSKEEVHYLEDKMEDIVSPVVKKNWLQPW